MHACRAVPVSISQLKAKMNAAAVVTFLTSQAFKWCMTLSLYIGSFGSFLVLNMYNIVFSLYLRLQSQ